MRTANKQYAKCLQLLPQDNVIKKHLLWIKEYPTMTGYQENGKDGLCRAQEYVGNKTMDHLFVCEIIRTHKNKVGLVVQLCVAAESI